jgi:hypothetical protein
MGSVRLGDLRHLEGFGLVRHAAESGTDRRERRWEAVARRFRFDVPDDEDGTSAARALAWEMFARAAELPERWATETEPALEPAWRRLSGLANTRVVVTAEELAAIEDAIEAAIAPYAMREERPEGSRGVRLLRYKLPEATDAGDA